MVIPAGQELYWNQNVIAGLLTVVGAHALEVRRFARHSRGAHVSVFEFMLEPEF